MSDAISNELAWSIKHAEHQHALARTIDDPTVQANARFWLGTAHGIRLAVAIAFGEAALAELEAVVVPDVATSDGMAVSA